MHINIYIWNIYIYKCIWKYGLVLCTQSVKVVLSREILSEIKVRKFMEDLHLYQ